MTNTHINVGGHKITVKDDVGAKIFFNSGYQTKTTSGTISATVTDSDSKYFINNVCQKAGLYYIAASGNTSSLAETTRLIINIGNMTYSSTYGESGLNCTVFASDTFFLNVGDTLPTISCVMDVGTGKSVTFRLTVRITKIA